MAVIETKKDDIFVGLFHIASSITAKFYWQF